MRCESCGTENPTGQRFCGHCGAALALICGSCGATNQPSQKYCGACGTSLVGAYEDAGIPFWMAVTLLEYAEWLADQGRADDATASLTEAREIFERLQARPWLERLHRVDEREGATP